MPIQIFLWPVIVWLLCWDSKEGFGAVTQAGKDHFAGLSKSLISSYNELIMHVRLELKSAEMTPHWRLKSNGLVQSRQMLWKGDKQPFWLFQAVFFQSTDIYRWENELCLSQETGARMHIITCHTQKRIAPRSHLWPREWSPAGHGVYYTNECFEHPYKRHSSEDMTVHRGQWELIGSLWLW